MTQVHLRLALPPVRNDVKKEKRKKYEGVKDTVSDGVVVNRIDGPRGSLWSKKM